MLLDRLRIHGKLTLLVIIPLLGVAGLAVPVVAEQVQVARRATATAEAVQLAGRVGTLIQTLQQERLMSIGYLLGVVEREDLVQQTAAVADQIADLREDFGDDLPGPVRAAVTAVQDLAGVRSSVLVRHLRHEQVMNAFSTTHTALINSLRLIEGVDTATPEGRQIVALDAVLRTDEHISAGAAYMLLVVATKGPGMATQYAANLAALQVSIDRFMAFATEEQQLLYTRVGESVNSRIGPDYVERVMVDPDVPVGNLSITRLFPAVSSLSTLGQFVEKKIITDVIAEIDEEKRGALTAAYAVGALVIGILVLVVLLSVAIARTVARPLTRLTISADRVARLTEAELVRVADDESESIQPVRLDPVDVSGRDEIGELARAFNRVQSTAARLVERQAASQRNVAQMFGHVGRRTQNLVSRQIALIDRLEHQETDPTRLQHLYRLDHVSSRLRRNAGSLVVLSGSASGDGHTVPLPLADVVRLALGEIEDYTRVDVEVRIDVSVAPGVIGDLVLALAELMENGTSFSPPHTRVTVSAEFTDHGVRISLVDRGIGMPIERMAEENARFTRRERLDLAPSEVLGLFVVGRLARRHGWGIMLTPTPGGGVTVLLDLDEQLLVRGGGRSGLSVVARASVAPPAPVPAGPADPTPAVSVGALAEAGLPPDPAPLAGLAPSRRPAPAPQALSLTTPRAASPTAPQVMPRDGAETGPGAEQLPRRRRPSATPATAPSAAPATATGTATAATPTAESPQRSTATRENSQQPAPTPVFDPAALTRATQSLANGQPWDAFATRSSRAGSASERGASERAGAAATRRSAGPVPAGGGALRQRVPGAQLPEAGSGRTGTSPAPADPAVVRALIEEFESGVRRAQDRTAANGSDPGTARERPSAAPRPPAPPRKLSRRVPGANLTVPLPGPPVLVNRPGDPEEVRDLINEFESGVARALSEVNPHPRHQERPT